MKPKPNCVTCGQVLPKRIPQPRDIVQVQGITDVPRLGIVLDTIGAELYKARWGVGMATHIRVMALSGPLAGLVTQYPIDRLTVVHGHFHVTERL